MSSSKPDPDDPGRALALATRYARGRVRSRADVLAYLRRRGAAAATAARVIAALQTQGLLDDAACARLWADHWARRGYGESVIRERLTAKGLEERVIELAARAAASRESEEARARRVVASQQRRPGGGGGAPRLLQTLRARGFDEAVIERVLPESAEA